MKTPLLLRLFTMMIVATVGSAPVAQAAVVLDQIYNDPPAGILANFSPPDMSFQMVQTFTVGIAGTLDHVDILARGGHDPPDSVRILVTSGGIPTNTVVATSNLVSLTGDGWCTVSRSILLFEGKFSRPSATRETFYGH